MNRLNAVLLGVAMILAGAGMAEATPTNLVTNGSFEFGTNPAVTGDWNMLNVGSTDLTGWSVIQSNIDWGNHFWQAADGTFSLDLNGNRGAGGISQTISTEVGKTYILQFALSGNPNLEEDYGIGGDLLVSLTASAGTTSADYLFNVLTTQTNSDMAWTNRSLVFTASQTSTLIRFVSTTYLPAFNINTPSGGQLADFPNCCYGPVLDNVSVVSAIPEPASLAVFGAGLAAAVTARRRKRRTLG